MILPTYDKKITVTFNSYVNLAQHMDHHEKYRDWMVDQVDKGNFPDMDNVFLHTAWYCENNEIDTMGADFPPWSPDIDGKTIQAVVNLPGVIAESLIATINEVSAYTGQSPDNIQVTDNV